MSDHNANLKQEKIVCKESWQEPRTAYSIDDGNPDTTKEQLKFPTSIYTPLDNI